MRMKDIQYYFVFFLKFDLEPINQKRKIQCQRERF
jgi:hypothetical protein